MPSSPLFDALGLVSEPVTLAAGTVLFRRGQVPSAVYRIHSGRVVLVWLGRKKIYPMDVVGPGSIVGLPAAFNGACTVTARTVEPCLVSIIPCGLFTDLMHSDPRLLRAATALLGLEVARARTLLFPSRARVEPRPQVRPNDLRAGTRPERKAFPAR